MQVQRERTCGADRGEEDGVGVGHAAGLQGGCWCRGKLAPGCDDRGAGGESDGGDVVRRERGVRRWVCERGDDGEWKRDGERGELRDWQVRGFDKMFSFFSIA